MDRQGERIPKETLEAFAAIHAGKRMPLNRQHDFALKSSGYIENLRVVPDQDSPGDWVLIGDVYYDEESLDTAVGGFSISFMQLLRQGESQDFFQVYLPYPYYNDHALVEELFEEGYTSVGKWCKKAAEPITTGLIVGAIILFVTPIWDDLYKNQIAPHIYRFFAGKFKKLQEKEIGVNFVQNIVLNSQSIQVFLIPTRGREQHCFSVERTTAAMALVHARLSAQRQATVPISKVILQFEDENDRYVLRRIEHEDGSLSDST